VNTPVGGVRKLLEMMIYLHWSIMLSKSHPSPCVSSLATIIETAKVEINFVVRRKLHYIPFGEHLT
jgi:hypothetical protein